MCWGFLFFWLEEWRRGGVRFGTVLRCLWGVVEPLQLHFLTAALACDATDWALSGSDVLGVLLRVIRPEKHWSAVVFG